MATSLRASHHLQVLGLVAALTGIISPTGVGLAEEAIALSCSGKAITWPEPSKREISSGALIDLDNGTLRVGSEAFKIGRTAGTLIHFTNPLDGMHFGNFDRITGDMGIMDRRGPAGSYISYELKCTGTKPEF